MKKIFVCFFFFSLSFATSYSFAQTWSKVFAGTEFSLALRSDGTLWAWGFNGNGQLGIGSTNPMDTTSPVRVGIDNDWSDIAAGAFHAIALKKNGTLWAWGLNGNGQVGDTSLLDFTEPVKIGADNDWSGISAAAVSSYAIKNNGSLWAWGDNTYGSVGDSTTTNKKIPTRIGTGLDWLLIRGGGFHVIAIKKDHSLWGWGYNVDGELGLGTTGIDSLPRQIGTDKNWTDASGGFEFSTGLKSDGSLWSWGFNGNGQLGLGNKDQQLTPQKIGTDIDWQSVEAGSGFAFGIKKDGSLWGWGYNGLGCLGDGTTSEHEQDSPEKIGGATDWKAVSGAKGFIYNGTVLGLHTLGIHNSGMSVCATGGNYVGQLGNSTKANSSLFDCSIGAISSVASNTPSFSITVAPNPARSIVTINAEAITKAKIEIFDIKGEQIFRSTFTNTLNWNPIHSDGSPVASGVYQVRISGIGTHGEPVIETRELIIAK